MNKYGQYLCHAAKERDLPGGKFLILLVGAYSAGITAPEMNGIAIIFNGKVLVDQWERSSQYTWHEPTARQLELFQELCDADWATFVAMVNQAPRLRHHLDLEPPKPKRLTKNQKIQAFAKAYALDCAYHEDNKRTWALAGKDFFSMLAKDVGGKARYNPAGIACSGDWSLHTDTLYVCINADKICGGAGYYRREVGREMSRNHQWKPPTTVAEYDALVTNLKRCGAPLFEVMT